MNGIDDWRAWTVMDRILHIDYRQTYRRMDIALNKPFMEVDGIGQLSRFHCIINYGTQIVSLKKSQSAAKIWNFP